MSYVDPTAFFLMVPRDIRKALDFIISNCNLHVIFLMIESTPVKGVFSSRISNDLIFLTHTPKLKKPACNKTVVF